MVSQIFNRNKLYQTHKLVAKCSAIMMASVVQRVRTLGVEVQHIPGGCTGICQPVDVGIRKPLKNQVTHCWEDRMVEKGSLDDKETKMPSREEVS
jgi:hypothetical protein